jgi:serine/threonine protein kinase
MAPEVICGQNHSYGVDYFAVGVMTYEFMLGMRPYVGRSRKEIKEMVLSQQVQVKLTDLPCDWSENSADFINKVYDIIISFFKGNTRKDWDVMVYMR